MDAAHLQRVALAFTGNLVTNHDSYGTTPLRVLPLRDCIKKAFIAQHINNPLGQFEHDFVFGDMDVTAIEKSDYLFC